MNKRDQDLANRVAQVANEQYFPDRYGWMDIDHRTLAYYDNNPITPEVREAARGVAITRAAAEGYPRIVAEGQYDDDIHRLPSRGTVMSIIMSRSPIDHGVRTTVTLPQSTLDVVKTLAREGQRSVGSVIRGLVESGLNRVSGLDSDEVQS